MNYKHHIIRNFPPSYPWWEKILANVMFFFAGIIIHHRKNLLTNKDLRHAIRKIKKGDVVLAGNLRRASHFIIRGPVTHSMFYAGRRTFIHSIADGVEEVSLHGVFTEYDTLIILRHKTAHKRKIKEMLKEAAALIGRPYDFEFNGNGKKFYCCKLIQRCLQKAGIKSGLKNHHAPIHPQEFINPEFKIIFRSHNIQIKSCRPILL